MKQDVIQARIPFLKSHNFLRTWSERQCEICEVEEVRLSFARPAPPVSRRRCTTRRRRRYRPKKACARSH